MINAKMDKIMWKMGNRIPNNFMPLKKKDRKVLLRNTRSENPKNIKLTS